MTKFTDLIDLASERLGGAVPYANDEFFAPKESLLKSAAAEWREGVYTDRGKWMDGWETRRRRSPGHDWCIIRLGVPGAIHGVVVDTSFFRGNYPDSCSIEATTLTGTPGDQQSFDDASTRWTTILAPSKLAGDAKNEFPIPNTPRATHLRFNIFPDGGVARLRVHGEPAFDADQGAQGQRARSRGDGERRIGARMQRHVLRESPQPASAGSIDSHGGWLGDQASSRTGA